ncbi:MAG: Na(+)-translocating NADH-quinone reductase subunit C [Candidatus Competibacteraceae bacterium]|nr:Na(+)-translocating NADH-quinone reductase subunit C [Candidatus Competibacteraceae bacterium]
MVGIAHMPNDSVQKTLFVALALCLVCSIVVAGAAVILKPLQTENRALNRKANILQAAGLYEEGGDVEAIFADRVDTRIVELSSGEYTDRFDPEAYDLRKASKDPDLSEQVPPDLDVANIKRKAEYAPVFLIQSPSGELDTIILPVHGYGLWSTLYGFLALEPDTKTVAGLKFYEHAETPGLGGEIDNQDWLDTWRGKIVYDTEWQPDIIVAKGKVDAAAPDIDHMVDGLAGASLTARGVMYLLQFWLSDQGFGPYLARMREST